MSFISEVDLCKYVTTQTLDLLLQPGSRVPSLRKISSQCPEKDRFKLWGLEIIDAGVSGHPWLNALTSFFNYL